MYYLSILIAITGLITYQLAMKTAPRDVNLWWLLTMAYTMAAVLCLVVGFGWRHWLAPAELTPSAAHLLPALAIGVTVILIEVGYLLVYRSGWNLSVAPAVAQAVTLSVFLFLGLLLFGEKITAMKAVGLVLCLFGIFLLTRKTEAPPSPPSPTSQTSAPTAQSTVASAAAEPGR
jgi:multidrug transporter EmrE-like cation transporter